MNIRGIEHLEMRIEKKRNIRKLRRSKRIVTYIIAIELISIIAICLSACTKEHIEEPTKHIAHTEAVEELSLTPVTEVTEVIEVTEPDTTEESETECMTKLRDIRYPLTAEERAVVEQVVMAEAGAEPYMGQMAVAQCILEVCIEYEMSPIDVVEEFGYTSRRKSPSASVRDAVYAVFDMGQVVTSEPIVYFYNPLTGDGSFHETQGFVIEIGNHKFFKAVH